MQHEPQQINVEAGSVTITWSDGVTRSISGDRLRAACPCAECQERDAKITRFIQLGNQSAIVDAVLVGGYALRFTFGDGHADGIYPYRTLYDLGERVE
jgi:DUF971 family protein